MNNKYAALILIGLVAIAGVVLVKCSTGEAPEGYDPTRLDDNSSQHSE